MRRESLWPLIVVAALLLVIGVLGAFQVHWVGEATRAQEQRILAGLDESGARLNEELTHELMQLTSAFEIHSGDAAEIARAYASIPDPRLVRAIYVLDPDHQTMRPFDLQTKTFGSAAERTPSTLGAPDLVIPIRAKSRPFDERDVPFVAIELDRQHLFGTIVPNLARRYFRGFDLAVAHDDTIIYRSDGSWPATVASAKADLARPLFMPMMRRAPAPPRAEWLLLARHSGLSLDELLARQRVHGLTVSLGILFILGCSLVVFAYAIRRAERLRRQQLEFIAGITHELHTPLAALAAAGQNLADGVNVDTAKYGEAIVKEARRLTDLVDGVLEFSGMEAGRNGHALARVDVREVIGDAVVQCNALARERGVTIETIAGDALPSPECDRAAVTRAVQNLVANAIRHGGEGGWVGITASAENGSVRITVADRGTGIAAADMPHLFEPFYRGRNAQVRGSGLGLAIVDRVARAHGGSITAANRQERGAEFTLRIPVQQ